MDFKTAKKIHVCKGCSKGIEYNEKYWSSPYKSLCVECYAVQQQNYSQPVKNGDPCYKCGVPCIGQIAGKPICETHIGDAVEAYHKGDTELVDKGDDGEE